MLKGKAKAKVKKERRRFDVMDRYDLVVHDVADCVFCSRQKHQR
jgi:thioredoxin-related protein